MCNCIMLYYFIYNFIRTCVKVNEIFQILMEDLNPSVGTISKFLLF